MNKQLIFVYNANEDVFSQVADYLHKVFSPKTYECNLCSLTHSNFGMKADWKSFIQQINADLEFFHKDEFCLKFPDHKEVTFPIIFQSSENNKLKTLISSEEINKISELKELQTLIEQRLNIG